MLITSAEIHLEKSKDDLKEARYHRRKWATITAGALALSGLSIELSSQVSNHTHNFGGLLGVTAAAYGMGAIYALCETLEGAEWVGAEKNEVRLAEQEVERMEAQRSIQPELELEF